MSVGSRRSHSFASTISAFSDASNLGLISNSDTGSHGSKSNAIGSRVVGKMKALIRRSSQQYEHGTSSAVSSTSPRISQIILARPTQKQDLKATGGVRYPKIEERLKDINKEIDWCKEGIDELKKEIRQNERKNKSIDSNKERTEAVASLGREEIVEKELVKPNKEINRELIIKLKKKQQEMEDLKKEKALLKTLLKSLDKRASKNFASRKDELRAKYQKTANSYRLEDYIKCQKDYRRAYQSAYLHEYKKDKIIAMYLYYMLS